MREEDTDCSQVLCGRPYTHTHTHTHTHTLRFLVGSVGLLTQPQALPTLRVLNSSPRGPFSLGGHQGCSPCRPLNVRLLLPTTLVPSPWRTLIHPWFPARLDGITQKDAPAQTPSPEDSFLNTLDCEL